MTSSAQAFIESTVAELKPIYKEYTLSEWEAATTGTPASNARAQAAQAAYMRFWADPQRFAEAKRRHQAGQADALLARQLKLIYLQAAENQQDDETIQRLTELEARVREQYTNFRPVVQGRAVSDNELDDLLAKSDDPALVREAWETSKVIGARVAGDVREMARVRNAAARRQGFRDYFERSLTLNEIDEEDLLETFARLAEATTAPFQDLKTRIDRARAGRFGLDVMSDLRPWHYGDRFFQTSPDLGDLDMDTLFADKDPVALATATYDSLGMDVRAILDRSDLYARAGKNQHAFCTDIDREGDVRTLNNLQPNLRWNETLLHELGHAVYQQYLDMDLPWLLRTPPHMLSTEAIALLMGSLTFNRGWLEQVAGVPPAEAQRVAEAAQRRERAQRLIFTRWVLVMTHFERMMYGDPERDLDMTWWDLVERYQLLRRPDGRNAPDWAAKIHIALYPVYYHNYELGHLVAAQLQHRLQQQAGGLVGRPAAGRWLIDHFFRPGASDDWAGHVKAALGEPLNPRYFVDALA